MSAGRRIEYDNEAFAAMVDRKRGARMAAIDTMPPDLRELVNDYGLAVVTAFTDLGIRKPKQIRHVVETILDEFSPTRGSFSKQGVRVEALSPSSDGEGTP